MPSQTGGDGARRVVPLGTMLTAGHGPFGVPRYSTQDMGALSAAAVGDELHVCAIDSGGQLLHTIRRADGAWQPVGKVDVQIEDGAALREVSASAVGADLHVCAISTSGRVWHAIRFANGSWQPFGDIEGQTGAAEWISAGSAVVSAATGLYAARQAQRPPPQPPSRDEPPPQPPPSDKAD